MRRTSRSASVLSVPAIISGCCWKPPTAYGIDLFRLFPVTEVITVSEPARFEALLDDIIRLWADPAAPFRGIRLAGLALQLAGCILQDWEREGMTARKTQLSRKDERLDRVITHLMAHAFGKVSREDLAKLVHLHPNYLDRIFEERFQMKPMQLLRDIRLREARRMLQHSESTLAEIAEACGLGDASYMSRKFVLHYGVTPGKFRERMRELGRSYYEAGDS